MTGRDLSNPTALSGGAAKRANSRGQMHATEIRFRASKVKFSLRGIGYVRPRPSQHSTNVLTKWNNVRVLPT